LKSAAILNRFVIQTDTPGRSGEPVNRIM